MSILSRATNAVYAWLSANFDPLTARRLACFVLMLATSTMLVIAPLVVLLMALWGAASNAWIAMQDAYYSAYDNFLMAKAAWKRT